MPNNLIPVAIMPWLKLDNSVKLGDVVFWPYYKLKNEYLAESDMLESLDKYAAAFKLDDNNKPAQITCVSYTKRGKTLLTNNETTRIHNAINALFAAAYINGIKCPDLYNLGFYLPATDHFTIFPLPNDKGIAKGDIVIHYPRLHVIGKIESFSIKCPPYIYNDYCPRFFSPLVDALDIGLRKSNKKMAKIWRSLEWFLYAQDAQPNFSEETRLATLCFAIDAALGETNGSRDFIKKVSNAITDQKLPKRYKRYFYSKKVKKSLQCNILQKWASDFYDLRNHIVHAKADEKRSLVWNGMNHKVLHSFIANYVWFECLWKALCDSEVIPPAPQEDACGEYYFKHYMKWYCKWSSPVRSLRNWWYDFLTNKIIDGE